MSLSAVGGGQALTGPGDPTWRPPRPSRVSARPPPLAAAPAPSEATLPALLPALFPVASTPPPALPPPARGRWRAQPASGCSAGRGRFGPPWGQPRRAAGSRRRRPRPVLCRLRAKFWSLNEARAAPVP